MTVEERLTRLEDRAAIEETVLRYARGVDSDREMFASVWADDAVYRVDDPFGEVRGVGQMIAAEFVADKGKKRFFDPKVGAHRVVSAKAFENGVLSRALPYIEVNSFSPPLSMTKAEADEAAERYAKALNACTDELARLAKSGA